MFESLKHWLESLDKESKLFNHPDDETVHIALASLLHHIISADNLESAKEKHKFSSILKEEFNLNDEQIEHLYEHTKATSSDLKSDLKAINEHLKDKPALRMHFMEKINQLIDIDSVKESELDIFYETMHVVFPEIKIP